MSAFRLGLGMWGVSQITSISIFSNASTCVPWSLHYPFLTLTQTNSPLGCSFPGSRWSWENNSLLWENSRKNKNYRATRMELLAMVKALKHFFTTILKEVSHQNHSHITVLAIVCITGWIFRQARCRNRTWKWGRVFTSALKYMWKASVEVNHIKLAGPEVMDRND